MKARRRAAARGACRRSPRRHRGLLTIIAPRHPARAIRDRGRLARRGPCAWRGARATSGSSAATDIYLADTLGELGLFYRLAGIAFIGGSLDAQGRAQPARSGAAGLRHPARPRHEQLRRRDRDAGRAPRRTIVVDNAERSRQSRWAACSTIRWNAPRARRRRPASPPTTAPCSTRCWSASRPGSTGYRPMPLRAPEFWRRDGAARAAAVAAGWRFTARRSRRARAHRAPGARRRAGDLRRQSRSRAAPARRPSS